MNQKRRKIEAQPETTRLRERDVVRRLGSVHSTDIDFGGLLGVGIRNISDGIAAPRRRCCGMMNQQNLKVEAHPATTGLRQSDVAKRVAWASPTAIL